MTGGLLNGVAFERVHFSFGLEYSGVQFNFLEISSALYIYF